MWQALLSQIHEMEYYTRSVLYKTKLDIIANTSNWHHKNHQKISEGFVWDLLSRVPCSDVFCDRILIHNFKSCT